MQEHVQYRYSALCPNFYLVPVKHRENGLLIPENQYYFSVKPDGSYIEQFWRRSIEVDQNQMAVFTLAYFSTLTGASLSL